MPEGVPVANLYYSDSPWSCAGEPMFLSLPDSFVDPVFVDTSTDSTVSISPQVCPSARGDLAGIKLISYLPRDSREEKGYGQDEVLLKPVDTCEYFRFV